MFSSVYSGVPYGANSRLIRVEADISPGFPSYTMVGYLTSEVRESRERVLRALNNAGMELKPSRITINLSPANFRKSGTAFDLPVAAALMAAGGFIPPGTFSETMVIGELSLDGAVCGTRGILSLVYEAKKMGLRRCIVPEENFAEATLIPEMEILCVHHLADLMAVAKGSYRCHQKTIQPRTIDPEIIRPGCPTNCDFKDLYGQEGLKAALEIAVAGFHHMLMVGPPGSGKSMAAACVASILPTMTFEESIDVTRIYSIAGLLGNQGSLITQRPFRQPHHTITTHAMIGGGSIPMPGEISLSHHGVLFLDELGEYDPSLIEMLRQPLENRCVTINRVHGTYVFPGSFMLLAAMNPCPCGYYPDRSRCLCSASKIRHYLRHVSMPILDRFDIGYEVPAADYDQQIPDRIPRTSATMRDHIEQAWNIQMHRFKDEAFKHNALIPAARLSDYCPVTSEAQDMLVHTSARKRISVRGRHKILRVARTIADLDQSDIILPEHMGTALGLRGLDEKYWQGELWT